MRVGENCVEFTLVKITYNSVEFTFIDTSNGLTNDKYGLYICEGDESSTCEHSGLFTLDSAVSYSYDVGTISGLKPNTLYTLSADAYPVSGVDAYGYITFTTGAAPKLIDLNGLEYFKTKMDANIASSYLPLTGGAISGDLDFSNSSGWLTPYLLSFKNANTSSSPAYPYTGFYQWGSEWQVNTRNGNNEFVKNLLSINNETGIATFAETPTVNGSRVALRNELPSDATIEFAESERFKCSNLLNATNTSATSWTSGELSKFWNHMTFVNYSGSTAYIYAENETTLDGHKLITLGGNAPGLHIKFKNLKPNTSYVFGYNVYSNTAPTFLFDTELRYANGTFDDTRPGLGFITDENGEYLYEGNGLQGDSSLNYAINVTFYDLQLNEGDFEEYTHYTGRIVHLQDLYDILYPVGAVYVSTVNQSPASFLGGTWTALTGGSALWCLNPNTPDKIAAGSVLINPMINGTIYANQTIDVSSDIIITDTTITDAGSTIAAGSIQNGVTIDTTYVLNANARFSAGGGDWIPAMFPEATGSVGFSDNNGGDGYHTRVNGSDTYGAFYGGTSGSVNMLNSDGTHSGSGSYRAFFSLARGVNAWKSDTAMHIGGHITSIPRANTVFAWKRIS